MRLNHFRRSDLAQRLERATVGALNPEIGTLTFELMLEAEVTPDAGASLHQRIPDDRSTHRVGEREQVRTTQVGDLTLAIPKPRQGCFVPN